MLCDLLPAEFLSALVIHRSDLRGHVALFAPSLSAGLGAGL
jgi:hypothetical protein